MASFQRVISTKKLCSNLNLRARIEPRFWSRILLRTTVWSCPATVAICRCQVWMTEECPDPAAWTPKANHFEANLITLQHMF
jgi:hypothetical protein